MNTATPAAACGFVAGAAACSEKTCGDVIANPSTSVCTAYLSTCYFNGTSCVVKPAPTVCFLYILTNATACNNLLNNNTPPAACGYREGNTNCTDKACVDVIANPSTSACPAYLSTCFFNGTSCQTKPIEAACHTYAFTNATACNNLVTAAPAVPCGYVTGAAACSAKACGDVIANPS